MVQSSTTALGDGVSRKSSGKFWFNLEQCSARRSGYASQQHGGCRVARNEEDARDLVQDALVIALRDGRLNGEDADAERRSWLRGVVRRHAAFSRRSAERRRRREQAPLAEPEVGVSSWRWQPEFWHRYRARCGCWRSLPAWICALGRSAGFSSSRTRRGASAYPPCAEPCRATERGRSGSAPARLLSGRQPATSAVTSAAQACSRMT